MKARPLSKRLETRLRTMTEAPASVTDWELVPNDARAILAALKNERLKGYKEGANAVTLGFLNSGLLRRRPSPPQGKRR